MPDLNKEKIILSGREEELKPIILSILAQNQILRQYDIGHFVGDSLDNVMRSRPIPLTIFIHYSQNPNPPWHRKGQKRKEITGRIPAIERSNVSWEKIKLAAGGANGYIWGRFKAKGNLIFDYGSTKINVWGGSGSEAEQRLRAYAALSEGRLTTINIDEEKQYGIRAKGGIQHKESTRIYPRYFTIVNQEQYLFAEQKGKANIDESRYFQETLKIPLWHEQKLNWIDEKIRELLKKGG